MAMAYPTFASRDRAAARKCYFAAGGTESDLDPLDDALWYWRRAAKIWQNKYESNIGRDSADGAEAREDK